MINMQALLAEQAFRSFCATPALGSRLATVWFFPDVGLGG
jgi:hypothetical protein